MELSVFVWTGPLPEVTAYRLLVAEAAEAAERLAGLRGRTWSVYSRGGGMAGSASRSGLGRRGSVDRDSWCYKYKYQHQMQNFNFFFNMEIFLKINLVC